MQTLDAGLRRDDAAEAEGGSSVRFLLYNIRYGTGAGWRFHSPVPFSGYLKHSEKNLEKITGFIRSVNPDIVGLIEVDGGSFRSGRCNQALSIAEALGHFHVYESKYPVQSVLQKMPLLNRQGNAFLTNRRITGSRFHYFRKGVKRLMIELDLEDCVIFLVHLSLAFKHRQYQLSDLYSVIKDIKKPVIVAGDLNVFSGDKELELFLAASGLVNANREKAPSYRKMQLDYLLHSRQISITNFEIPKIRLSDHYPIVCDFEVNTKGTGIKGQ